MNNLKPCKKILVQLCSDEIHRVEVQKEFHNVEVMDDGQRLLIKERDNIVHGFNMKYVLSYQAELNLEED